MAESTKRPRLEEEGAEEEQQTAQPSAEPEAVPAAQQPAEDGAPAAAAPAADQEQQQQQHQHHYDAAVASGPQTMGPAAFPVVRLRGLPFDVNDADVRGFLVSPVMESRARCCWPALDVPRR